jgi:hypothetical protein
MKRLVKVLITLVSIAVLMFAEYRFIMLNLCPYFAEDGFLCIEFMGQVDSYYAEPIFSEE